MLFQSKKIINKILTIFLALLLTFNFMPLSFATNDIIETIDEQELIQNAIEHVEELRSRSINEQAQILSRLLSRGEYRESSDANQNRHYIQRMARVYSNEEISNIVKNSTGIDWEEALAGFRTRTESDVAQHFPNLSSAVQNALGQTEQSDTTGDTQLTPTRSVFTLEGNHTMSDIYPSFIYSTTSNKFASAKDFTPDELARYPNLSNSESKQVYGQLLSRGGSDPQMSAGSQFASYMRTLFEYNWLQNDVVTANRVGSFMGDAASFGLSSILQIIDFLTVGIVSIFEYIDLFFDPIFDTIGDIFSNLNVVSIFQVGTRNVQHDTNTGEDSKGLLQETIQQVFNAFGLTPRNITLIRNLFLLVVIVTFLMLLVYVIRQGKGHTKSVSKLKLYFVKGLTIILVIPVGLVLKDGMDQFADALDVKGRDIRNSMIDSYVVDTLRWATTSNLSLHPLTENTFDSRGATINENAQPTTRNIGRINEMINSFDSRVQYSDVNTSIKNGSIGNDGRVAREPIMDKVGNRKLLSVNNYFSRLASMGGTTNIPAAVGINSDSRISVGNFQIANFHPYDKPIYPHYMFFGKQGENVVGNELDLSTLTENTSEKKSWWESIGNWVSDQWEYLTGNDGDVDVDEETRRQIISKITLSTSDGKSSELLLPGSSKMSFVKGSWNNGYSYMYGAVNSKSVNATFGVKSNYIADPTTGPDFGQNLNPITMDNIYNYDNQSLEEINNLIAENSEEGRKAFHQRMLDTNALTIALMNRYQGITTVPGGRTISNQSVAFLLQTVYDGGVYRYIGQNIPTSLQSGTMNHGTQYNGFKQYVIPNTGPADYGTKFFTLSVTVVISAMVSCIAIYSLLTGPILSTIYKVFASFGKAFFAGNTAMLFTYAFYYFALRMTMIFLQMSRYAVIAIASFITNIIPGSETIQELGHIPIVGQFFVLVIAIIVGFVLIKPWLQIPGPNGMKEVSVVSAFLEAPLMFASIADGKVVGLYNKAFGIKAGSGKNKIAPSKWAKDEVKHKKETGKELVKSVGKLTATTLGAGLLGGALSKKLNDKLDENDNESTNNEALGAIKGSEEEVDSNVSYDKESVDSSMSSAIASAESLGENAEEVKSVDGGNFDNAIEEADADTETDTEIDGEVGNEIYGEVGNEVDGETDNEVVELEEGSTSDENETQNQEDGVEVETDLEGENEVENEGEGEDLEGEDLEASESESDSDDDSDTVLANQDVYDKSDLEGLGFDNQAEESELSDDDMQNADNDNDLQNVDSDDTDNEDVESSRENARLFNKGKQLSKEDIEKSDLDGKLSDDNTDNVDSDNVEKSNEDIEQPDLDMEQSNEDIEISDEELSDEEVSDEDVELYNKGIELSKEDMEEFKENEEFNEDEELSDKDMEQPDLEQSNEDIEQSNEDEELSDKDMEQPDLEQSNEDIEVSNEDMEQSDLDMEQSNEDVEVSNEDIEVSNEDLDIEQSNEDLDIEQSNEDIEQSNEDIEQSNGEVEVSNEDVDGELSEEQSAKLSDLKDEYDNSSKEVKDVENEVEKLKSKQEKELEDLENQAKEEQMAENQDRKAANVNRELTPEELKLERKRKANERRNLSKNKAKAEFANVFKRAVHSHDNKKQKDWENEEIEVSAYTDKEIDKFVKKQEKQDRKKAMKQFRGKSKKEVRNDVNNWKKEINDSQNQVTAKNEEFSERKKELNELIKSNNSKKESLLKEKSSLQAKFEGNKSKINKEKAKIKERKQRIESLKSKNSEQKLDLLNKQLGELNESDNTTKQKLIKERKEVQDRINSTNDKIRKEEENIKTHQDKIGVLNSENSDYQKEILSNNKKARELEENTRINKERVGRLKREKDRLEREHNQKVKDLNRKITLGDRYAMSNIDKGIDYVNHQMKNRGRKNELRDKSEQLEIYQRELLKARENKNKEAEQALEGKIEETKNSIKDLRNKMNYRRSRGLTTDTSEKLRESLNNQDFSKEKVNVGNRKSNKRRNKERKQELNDLIKSNKSRKESLSRQKSDLENKVDENKSTNDELRGEVENYDYQQETLNNKEDEKPEKNNKEDEQPEKNNKEDKERTDRRG